MDSAQGGIAVVGDRATVTGFRLAGITNGFVVDYAAAGAKVEEIIDGKSADILVLNEKIISSADWRLKKKIERTAKPVIITVPDREGPSAEAESLKELIKKTLGFELMK